MENSVCVICCRDVKVFAVGFCDHPICQICSTRLRVLCKQNECPICRRDMPKVFFSLSLHLYEDVSSWKNKTFNYRYKICFENEMVQSEFWKLLDHSCEECTPVCNFRTLKLLAEHFRKIHEKFYCDLCVEHLDIFTHERKSYTRKDLARHRRIGDINDTSHRGHPLCKFCDKRFMDNDILFKHLRRDHFFCHFCDGYDLNEYYGDYTSLRDHFKEQHFLCEEDRCINEKFTSVFRSDIDLKAHISLEHSRNMSKAQAKQTRTLEIEFAMAPRSNQNTGVIRASDYSDINRVSNGRKSAYGRTVPSSNITTIRAAVSIPERCSTEGNQNINTNCKDEFPTIDGSSASVDIVSQYGKPNPNTLADKLASNNRFTVGSAIDEDFPSLSSVQPSQPVMTDYSYVNGLSSKPKVNKSAGKKIMSKVNDTEDFPSLSQVNPRRKTIPAQPNLAHNISIKVNHKMPTSMPSNQPTNSNWISNTKNISIQSSVPINDSGGSSRKMSGKSQRKPSSIVPDANEKNFPALIPTASAALSVERPRKTEKCEDKNVPFISVTSKKDKGKKMNKTEDSVSENEDTKRKKKSNIGKTNGEIATNNFKSKNSENQENIKPSLDLGHLSLTGSTSDTDKNDTGYKDIISEKNNNIPKTADDFPVLGPSQRPRVPPPGFSSSVSHNISSAPPGFNLAAVSTSVPTTNVPSFTFTNSSGQDYSMCATEHLYNEPDNFSMRNRRLISTIKSVLQDNNSSFDNFKTLSSDFRKDRLSAKDYYKKCIQILGNNDFEKIFAELLVLLPDIDRQQQLLSVHNSSLKSQGGARGAKPKSTAWICSDFVVCKACQQVLSQEDFRNHIILHNLENNFPSLPCPDGANKLDSWRKC